MKETPQITTKIYGYSDDLVIIEEDNIITEEIDCYERDVLITFQDNTVICVGYSKPDIAVWYISVENAGSAESTLTVCDDEDADVYSDIFEINSQVAEFSVINKQL